MIACSSVNSGRQRSSCAPLAGCTSATSMCAPAGMIATELRQVADQRLAAVLEDLVQQEVRDGEVGLRQLGDRVEVAGVAAAHPTRSDELRAPIIVSASSHASALRSTPTPVTPNARGADQEARVAAAEVDDVPEVGSLQHARRVGRDVVAADQRGAFGDPAAGALDVGAVSARARR